MSDLQLTENMYPPGWDVKYDTKTGKCYYINYLTKAMQLEDPRIRYRQLQNEHASTESIPMQTSSQHGSPYHVYQIYPINNHPPAVQAFQAPNTASLYNVSTSPLLTNKLHKMEMSPIMRMGSPNISRIQYFDKTSQNGSTCGNYQETSFITQADTDAAVAKINAMFPTASDAHIRLLLKKYMKSIFPKAEEMLLLDVLANADNNVQKASEKLLSMGYDKRDTTTPKPTNRAREEQILREKIERENTPPPQPRLKSNEEKQKIKNQLKGRYKGVAGRIITMALESVDYSEEKACKILEIVMQDDKGTKEEIKHEVKEMASVENETAPPCAGPAIVQTEATPDVVDHERPSILGNSLINSVLDNKSVYKSPWNKNKLSIGPNAIAVKGPNEDLLLADYIAWNGANSDLCKGSRCLAKGSDPTMRSSRLIQAQGSKSELCKGPNTTLAKGSIYAQLIANVKCN